MMLLLKGEWDEASHPRADDGRFGDKPGDRKNKPGGKKPAGADKPAESSSPTSVPSKLQQQAREAVGKIKKAKGRAFMGKPTGGKISKQLAGAIGEEIIIQWLKGQGFKDAGQLSSFLGSERNNLPVDLVHDHRVIEVKTGQSSNGAGAQQWRLTIGEPGAAEKAALAAMTDEEKAAWNARKQAMIHERKEAEIAKLGDELGYTVKGQTMTVILNPDTQTADIYVFDGFHDRIGWTSDAAKAGYVGSVTYGN